MFIFFLLLMLGDIYALYLKLNQCNQAKNGPLDADVFTSIA